MYKSQLKKDPYDLINTYDPVVLIFSILSSFYYTFWLVKPNKQLCGFVCLFVLVCMWASLYCTGLFKTFWLLLYYNMIWSMSQTKWSRRVLFYLKQEKQLNIAHMCPLEIVHGHSSCCNIVSYRSVNNDVNMNSKHFIQISVHLSSSIFEIASISVERSYAVTVSTGNTNRWLHSRVITWSYIQLWLSWVLCWCPDL